MIALNFRSQGSVLPVTGPDSNVNPTRDVSASAGSDALMFESMNGNTQPNCGGARIGGSTFNCMEPMSGGGASSMSAQLGDDRLGIMPIIPGSPAQSRGLKGGFAGRAQTTTHSLLGVAIVLSFFLSSSRHLGCRCCYLGGCQCRIKPLTHFTYLSDIFSGKGFYLAIQVQDELHL